MLRCLHSCHAMGMSGVRGAASNSSGGVSSLVWGLARPSGPAHYRHATAVRFGRRYAHPARYVPVGGGFDPAYLRTLKTWTGLGLWVLGIGVVYAREAVGATSAEPRANAPAAPPHTLWESTPLATVLKNYEGGNMERVLSAALLLEYRRALLAAGDAFKPGDYGFSATGHQAGQHRAVAKK